MLDCLDREICVGDTVVVAGRYSSSIWLDKKTVVAVDDHGVPTLEGEKSKRKYQGGSRAIMVVSEPSKEMVWGEGCNPPDPYDRTGD